VSFAVSEPDGFMVVYMPRLAVLLHPHALVGWERVRLVRKDMLVIPGFIYALSELFLSSFFVVYRATMPSYKNGLRCADPHPRKAMCGGGHAG
jgi:hypothetical protein